MRILIVDDEITIRRHLKLMLEEMDIEIFEAEHGIKALELLERVSIHIMLTDIRMPVMDGIDLIKETKARYPNVWPIVLSNYADFSLAQQAMRFGAKNYVIKATMEKKLLMDELMSAYREQQLIQQHRTTLDSNERMLLLNSLFHEALKKHESLHELRQRAAKLDIPFFQLDLPQSYFSLLEINRFTTWAQHRYSEQLDLALFSVMNVVAENLKSIDGRNEIIHLTRGQFIVLDIGEQNPAAHEIKCVEIQRILKEYLKLDASFIMHYSFCGMKSLTRELNNHLVDFDRLFYEERPLLSMNDAHLAAPVEIDLYRYLQQLESIEESSGQADKLYNWIEAYFQVIIYSRRPSFLVKEDLKLLITFIEKHGYIVSTELKESIEHQRQEQIGAYKQLFYAWMAKLQLVWGHRKEITEILYYIHSNYQRKITLDELSAYVHLSRSHLSKMFKDQLGVAITDYIEAYRMKQAKLLLRTTALTISEIGERVGISDIFYFSKLYKRFYRVNPSKDRQSVH